MFKGTISAVTTTANANVPITVVWNTNDNTRYNTSQNALEITKYGYYNVNATLNITNSTPTTIQAQLFADGTAIAESLVATDITATTGKATLNIADTIKAIPSSQAGYLDLSLQLNGVATITNGVVTVERVQ